MTELEIIDYLTQKSKLSNPSPNKFKKPAKQFLIKYASTYHISETDLKILFYMWVCGVNSIPICEYPGCVHPVRFLNFNVGFSKGCCHMHAKKISNLDKFGVETPFQSEKIQQKVKDTFLLKYGNAIPTKTENYLSKMLTIHGVSTPMKSPALANKLHNILHERYGGSGNASQYISSRHSMTRKRNFLEYIDSDDYPAIRLFDASEYLGVKGFDRKYDWCCKKCMTMFSSTITDGLKPKCPQCYPPLSGSSYLEKEIANFIQEDKIENDRQILNGKELDILIPSKNLAIEINGIYWHSEIRGKDEKYHISKTIQCNEKGIQLIHIFENEWIYQQSIVKSIINSKLGIYDERIFARKCQIKEISSKEKSIFLKENHLQGNDSSSIRLGLFHKDELISLMTFGRSRFDKKIQYEMYRFCNKKGFQIIGGASKLLKYFIKNYDPESIVTYADRRYSDGSFYEKIGFSLSHISSPNFWVFGNKIEGLDSRLNWQKHRLKDKLERFDENLTAWENMQINGYDRIWDCGNFVFKWRKE